MTYLDLRKAFHDTAQDADQLYDRRFNDERTWHLKTSIAGSPAFVYMAPEIYEALLEAAQIDKVSFAWKPHFPSEPSIATVTAALSTKSC